MIMTEAMAVEAFEMCKGIAKSQIYKFFDMSVEELATELLGHLYDMQYKADAPLDKPLMATMCWTHITDLQRKGARRKEDSSSHIMETWDSEDGTDIPSGAFVSGGDYADNLNIDVLLNETFEEGSRESIFVRFYAVKAGLISDPRFDKYEKINKSALATELGFVGGTGNSSFKKFDAQMKQFISEYFGVTIK